MDSGHRPLIVEPKLGPAPELHPCGCGRLTTRRGKCYICLYGKIQIKHPEGQHD